MRHQTNYAYSHVKAYRVLINLEHPLQCLRQIAKYSNKRITKFQNKHTLKLDSHFLRRFGFQYIRLKLQVRDGKLYAWFKTARPNNLVTDLIMLFQRCGAVDYIKKSRSPGSLGSQLSLIIEALNYIEYYITLREQDVTPLLSVLPPCVIPQQKSQSRKDLHIYYANTITLLNGPTSEAIFEVICYRLKDKYNKTPGFVKLEIKGPVKHPRYYKNFIVPSQYKKLMQRWLWTTLDQAGISSQRKPKMWVGARIRKTERIGSTERSILSTLSNIPQLSFSQLRQQFSNIAPVSLRSTLKSMHKKGLVYLERRKHRFRSVKLRSFIFEQ